MSDLYLGKNALTGRKVFAPISCFTETHTHILGATGMGKSKLLERLARDIITAGYGLIVLDGKGDLYDNLLHFCAYMHHIPDQLHLIDPRDRLAPGVNVLEPISEHTNHITIANSVIDALQKMHREEETRQWLERYGRAALSPLSRAGLTVIEAFDFTITSDPSFRRAVLAQINDIQFTKLWAQFEDHSKNDRALRVEVLHNRIDLLLHEPYLCGMFGQEKSTLHFKPIMDQGQIVLAQLAQGADHKALSFTGAALIHKIKEAAYTRPQGHRRPCFVLIDEFQKFISPDIADALATLRGFGVPFILAHQDLEQLRNEDPQTYAAVKGNARNRMTFAGSHEDSEVMYRELFSDRIYDEMQKVKDEIWQTKAIPIDTTHDIYTENDSDAETILPDERTTSTTGHGSTHAQVPGVIHDIIRELSGRSFFTEPEVKAKLISWIHTQHPRHYQLKLGHLPAVPMVSPTVRDRSVSPKRLEDLKARVYHGTSRPIAEVRREVDQRVKNYLAEHAPPHDDEPRYTSRKKKTPAV